MTRARSLKMSVLVATAVLALSGCGVHPGAAAVVGDTTITEEQVDGAAVALCSANTVAEDAPALASRGARQAALNFLIDSELSRQFAESEEIEPDQEQVSATLAQNAAGIEALPEDEREDFRELLIGFRESELILTEAGLRSLQEQGVEPSAPQEAASEGARLRAEWAQSLDVEVDPRFGDYAEGGLTPASGSLSVPVSERAAAGAEPNPGDDWVAGLPASQKCA